MTTHPIALDALEAHTLIVGTTGSGKTYLTRGLLEQLRAGDRRVGAIDKMGNLWGVTSSADGKTAGLEFVIFGGKRAQVPMTPADGAKLGRVFAERGFPAIFDVSQWKRHEQEEWVAAFADALFETNELSTHLVLDEAQSWVPQGGGGDAFRAVQRLAEQGRGNGIHLMLAVQRMARLDATVRGMMQGLTIAMRQTSMLDRKAVRDHVGGDTAALFEGLPHLPAGTGYVYDPAEATIDRVSFPKNATFDSSRTPRHGDTPPAPIAISGALVEELKKALAPAAPVEVPDDHIPSDPIAAAEKGGLVGGMLKKRDERIAELEAENAELRAKAEHLRGVDQECDRYNAGIGAAIDILEAVQAGKWAKGSTSSPAIAASDEDGRMTSAPFKTATKGPRTGSGAGSGKPPAANASLTGVTAGETAPASDLPPRHRRILEAIGWSSAYLRQASAPRAIVAWMADVSPRASGFQNDLGALRTAGLVIYPAGGEVALTDAGREACPPPRAPRDRDALWAAISGRLQPRLQRIVNALWDKRSRTRGSLAQELNVSAKASGFQNDLGHLRSLGLIDYPSAGVLQLAELLA